MCTTSTKEPVTTRPQASAPLEVQLIRGLPGDELRAQVAYHARGAAVFSRALAFYLADAASRRLCQEDGCAQTADWAEREFDIDRRRARELIRVGSALFELPAIDAAFREGRLSWSRVLELVKVATPEHEAAWLEHALGCTVRQLKLDVRLARPGAAPRKPGETKGLHEVRFPYHTDLDAVTHAMAEQAHQKMSDECGRNLGRAEFLQMLFELALNTEDDGTMPGRKRVDASLYRLHVRPEQDASRASEEEVRGERVLLLETDDGPVPIIDRGVVGCEAAETAADGRLARKTDAALRARVLSRDKARCRCCGSRRSLHAHHIQHRSKGGPTTASNLITVCQSCHALLHENLLVIEGTDARSVRWRDAAGQPLDQAARRRYSVRQLPAGAVGLQLVAPNVRRGSEGGPSPAGPESVPGPVPFAQAFADVIGQDELLDRIHRTAQGADALGKPYPHTLFWGPPGTGKTTLARSLAAHRGVRLHTTSGPFLRKVPKLLRILRDLRPGALLFIDEIHDAAKSVLEVLYEAMDAFRISDVAPGADRSADGGFEVAPFTLLAATTEPGALPNALRSRFGMQEALAFYDVTRLTHIVQHVATDQGFQLEPDAAREIAKHARGTPREALRLLDRCRFGAAAGGERVIRGAHVRSMLADLGVDEHGLRPEERRYLSTLARQQGPVPLSRLAIQLGLDVGTVARDIEPNLVTRGLIRVTPRGRLPNVRRDRKLVLLGGRTRSR